MNDPELKNFIKRLRHRVRLLLAERYALFGAGGGAIVSAILALLSLRYDALISYALWIGVVALGAALGALWGLVHRLDDLSVAAAVDKRAGLKERISTAVMLPHSDSRPAESAVITDAISHTSGLRPKDVFPHRFGLPHGAFGITLILLAAAILLPQMPAMQSGTRRQEVQVMKREGVKLEKIAKDIHKQTSSKHEELRNLANKLNTLGKKMQTGRMTRKQAMLKTRKLSKQIKEQQDLLAKQNSAAKPMDQAQLEMQKASEQLAQKMAEELAKKENIPLSEAMKKLPTDQRMAELARKEGPLSESERKELEKLVSKYANPNSGLPVPSELAEAMAKLAQNKDYQKAAELMRKLAQRLNSSNMSKQDKEALKKQMEALAKALKNTDLDKLAKAMRENAEKLANMSDEELKKLMKQIKEMQKLQKMCAKAGGG
ncbi:MAG: hypothetical protein ABFD83_09310 [Armatimonadota bacterium]